MYCPRLPIISSSSNGKNPAFLARCTGNSPVTGDFPSQRPVTRSFDVSTICAWMNCWVNNREAGDLRRQRAHYVGTAMLPPFYSKQPLMVSKRLIILLRKDIQTSMCCCRIYILWEMDLIFCFKGNHFELLQHVDLIHFRFHTDVIFITYCLLHFQES